MPLLHPHFTQELTHITLLPHPLLHPHFTLELTHITLLPHPLPHLLPFTLQLTNPLPHFTPELMHTMLLPDPHSHTMPVTPLLPLLPKPSKFVQYFSTNKQTYKLKKGQRIFLPLCFLSNCIV